MNHIETTGAYLTIELHMNFADLAAKFNLPVSEIYRMWNEDELADYINLRLNAGELVRMAGYVEPVEIGGGYI